MHRHIVIVAVTPSVDGGRYVAKAIAGDPCIVEADVFRDGHGLVRAAIKWKMRDDAEFGETSMDLVEYDRFRGEFPVDDVGAYVFTIEAWTDADGTWLECFDKKVKAGRDIALILRDGVALLEAAAERAGS